MRKHDFIYTDFRQLADLKAKARQDRQAALKETAKQFEALFLQMVLKQMRQASPGDPLLGSDRSRFYRDMYDQQLALHLARQGSVGIAEMIVRQLSRRQPAPVTSQDLAAYRRHPLPASPPAAEKQRDALNPAPTLTPKPVSRFESAEQFLHTLLPEARRVAAKIGVDPKLLLAQAALETGWGRKIIHHADGRSSYNLFNIKAGRSWQGDRVQVNTLEYLDGIAVRKQAQFRAYQNYRQSFEDYLSLLQSPRYAEALRRAADPEGYLRALQRAGYATDPDYADKILAIYWRQDLASL
ncbi:MAG TPA: flagellar assembly peptidoglycan hydrolase FlgJ [Methylothermaceae bacterium]|nr:flagellar assembly peptidoglycan hydrolase FlgJ [Methylothermaceae bacterium]